MLTIAKMGAHSVAYYQPTVDEDRGPDSYYSEDGKRPASVWIRGVFLYRLSTSRVEKSGADSLCGVVWTGLFSGMTASRLGFYPVG
ncbi:hypothetical protein FRC0470_01019 [Corynebacterium diphtheriae]|nr:hypothetical protein FRC0432_02266 [Corynebacterium diphtheriae]CAB0950872.1 hypothetical protein FRC0470_01019 [Corynebacterium diphtheriae]